MAPRLIKSLFLMLLLCITGCGEKVELHGQLSEQEANEVIAELADMYGKVERGEIDLFKTDTAK